MKTLLLMRHSIAASDNSAWTDRERPLTDSGRQLARRTAERLSATPIDHIVCSSAVRTSETAQIIAETNNITSVDARDELYLARARDYFLTALTLSVPEESHILIVGHNPGIASLIYDWAVVDTHIAPATVAKFQFATNDWSNVTETSPTFTELISNGQVIAASDAT